MKYLLLLLLFAILQTSCKQITNSQAEGLPNILFAIADDQSYAYASAYGTEGISTPAFDRVAREGALFNNAFVAAPQCSPSRAAILTGRNIWQLEEAGTHGSYFPKKYQVFTDLLEQSGYQIGYTGKAWGPGNWEDAGWKRNPVGNEYNDHVMEAVPASGINVNDYFTNFTSFYKQKSADSPFFFWYGCHEPHRTFEQGSGYRAGKKAEKQAVPAFLPDHDVVRKDIADYSLEIEWFDKHLGSMIRFLEEKGELERTIIIVTSDNGMPFPAAKANLQEYGTHVPLAICWPEKMKGNRLIDDLVSMIDVAPTLLEIAGIEPVPGMSGRSMLGLLLPEAVQSTYVPREFVLTGRERHTHARPDNLGYPARSMRTRDFLYVRNFKPELWPAGNPASDALEQEDSSKGFKAMDQGFHDVDASPSKSLLFEESKTYPDFYELAFGKRPAEQLYDLREDPFCTRNIAGDTAYSEVLSEMRNKLEHELSLQEDPRVMGFGDIFDSYPRCASMRNFPGFHKQGAYNPTFIQKEQKLIH